MVFNKTMTDECSICLEIIAVVATGCVTMSCSHKYHLKCIARWLTDNDNCCPYVDKNQAIWKKYIFLKNLKI